MLMLQVIDDEINKLTAQLEEFEEENKKLQQQFDKTLENSAFNKEEIDSRSAFVGNVDFSTTPEELEDLFKSCGAINRVTILVNKFTGKPKGYAYIEFTDKSSVATAVGLHESLFKGRPLKVVPKRSNVPKFMRRKTSFRRRRRRRY
eukprot:TRINITY_DN1295_c0_g1_i1.p1 TRINITY_DN1295_c0_g1~~TRINITY_DN1295_c0_g1_i1.p1  ORF type:complete len:147 (-),score=43.13 TRINITY_DN1295_c0_g1_i1:14-454(-)